MKTYQWAVIEANLNPATGAEQKGIRPVIIVSNEEFNQAMPNVTVVPLTYTKRHLYPSEVFLPKGKAGQPFDSIIMVHQIRIISKKRLEGMFGHLEDVQLQNEVRTAIREHLDIS